MQSSPFPRKQGVVAVVSRDDRLLVIRRSQFVVAPRAYCFPGGGVHCGEDEQQALIREMQEELHLDAQPIRRLWQSRTSWHVELSWWQVDLPTSAKPHANEREVESIHWFTREQLHSLAGLLDSNHDFLVAWRQGVFQLP